MHTVSIIGAGNMGSVIAAIAVKGGAEVQILAREPDKARAAADPLHATASTVGDALTGDIVVFAVPYAAVAELMATYADQLDGKIVVDITNPIAVTSDALLPPADSSAAHEIAAAAPGARVLKAFNTALAGTLTTGRIGEVTPTVLVAGDDQEAKGTLIALVTGGGVKAVDVGTLARARELEALGFLQIKLASAGTITWMGGFALIE